MSINTQKPMNKEAREMMNKLLGEPTAKDDYTALFDRFQQLDGKSMGKLANTAGQTVTVELNDIGDKKTLGDVDYILTESGWEKQPIKLTNNGEVYK